MKHLKALILAVLCAAAAACGLIEVSAAAPAEGEARVVVVGGGLAGLVAAYELQNKGIAAHVLEAGDRWGGRVATVEYANGLRSEYGMHEIWDSNTLLAYVKKFNIPLSGPEEPYSSVVMNGKYYPYVQPSVDKFFATMFTPREIKDYRKWLKKAEELYDESEAKGLTPRLAEIQKLSFAQWVGSANLSPAVSEFIRMGVECEVATDWSSISAVYGLQQLSIFMHGSEQCRHVVGGNQKIVESFVDSLKGPKTRGALVTRIVRTKNADGGTEVVVHYKKDGVMRSLRAEKAVVAVPFHVLHAIQFEPGLTEDQWKAVDSLIPGMYTVVHFIIDAKAAEKLLVDGNIPFPVLTRGPLGVVYGFLEKPAASQTEMVFTLLVHGDYTRSYLESRDKTRQRLLAELDKIWLGFSGFVKETHFYGYHPAATPGWGPGRSPLDSLHASLRTENVGLYLAGDYIYSSHADGTVKSGQDVAGKIAKQLKSKP
ncbi:MAG: FAD-dependent oxidoreductase [Elusimicrobia bacterium]|nr:FAD-dependent oxidoreductase [Elusimicrobiota bacterium]